MQQSTSSPTEYPTVLSGVVRFNVSGTTVELSRDMLELYPKSLLRELAQKCPEGAEAFIDRDPSGLKMIVDYLHCGSRVIYNECNNLANTEYLEKEAEVILISQSINIIRFLYYGIDDLAIKCSTLYEFKPRCEVNWRPEVVESYYPLFAKCIIDPQLVIPFTYEKNSHIIARCIACEESYEPKASNVFVFSLHEWGALKHHMLNMLGIVEKLIGYSCLLIRWSNGIQTHLPKTAVRVVIDDM